MKTLLALCIALLALGQSTAARAQSPAGQSTGQQVAYGVGSVLGTLVYAPVKTAFCILGAVSSGFAFPIAGPKTAGNIASTTCGGTWVVTPSALEGKEPVRFVGGS